MARWCAMRRGIRWCSPRQREAISLFQRSRGAVGTPSHPPILRLPTRWSPTRRAVWGAAPDTPAMLAFAPWNPKMMWLR